MRKHKIITRSILLVLLLGLASVVWYAWQIFPLISGYGAKNLCSAFYLQHRNPKDVIREDLGDFPSTLGTPFAGSEYTFDHMGIDKKIKANITHKYYEAGHMMYIHNESAAKFKKDVADFITGSLK